MGFHFHIGIYCFTKSSGSGDTDVFSVGTYERIDFFDKQAFICIIRAGYSLLEQNIDFSTLPDLSPDFDTYLYNILQKLRMDLLKTYSWLEEKECLGISDLFLETRQMPLARALLTERGLNRCPPLLVRYPSYHCASSS